MGCPPYGRDSESGEVENNHATQETSNQDLRSSYINRFEGYSSKLRKLIAEGAGNVMSGQK